MEIADLPRSRRLPIALFSARICKVLSDHLWHEEIAPPQNTLIGILLDERTKKEPEWFVKQEVSAVFCETCSFPN
jgi:hypothetical protein